MKKKKNHPAAPEDTQPALPGFHEAIGEPRMQAFLAQLQSEYDETTDKKQFFEKYRFYYNCYAYASGGMGTPYADTGEGRFYPYMAVPGAAGGDPMRLATPQELDRALIADGYQRTIPPDIDHFLTADARARWNQNIADEKKPGQTLVAAFINEKDPLTEAYHFAVRGDTGQWSQKFGRGVIQTLDEDGTPLRPPHSGDNCFQQADAPEGERSGWKFVGYYWRPAEGIRTASNAHFPVVGLPAEEPGRTRQDVWMNATGVLSTAEEVKGWSLSKREDGRFELCLENAHGTATRVTLPEAFTTISDDGTHSILVNDPSGPAIDIELSPNGQVTGTEIPNPRTTRPSPFTR